MDADNNNFQKSYKK